MTFIDIDNALESEVLENPELIPDDTSLAEYECFMEYKHYVFRYPIDSVRVDHSNRMIVFVASKKDRVEML